MSKSYKLVEFQKNYYMLDNKFKKADEDLFNLGILVAYTSELDRGFIVKNQLKTNSKGTKFNYKKANSQEEIDEYVSKVKEFSKSIEPQLIIGKFKSKIEQIAKENEKEEI